MCYEVWYRRTRCSQCTRQIGTYGVKEFFSGIYEPCGEARERETWCESIGRVYQDEPDLKCSTCVEKKLMGEENYYSLTAPGPSFEDEEQKEREKRAKAAKERADKQAKARMRTGPTYTKPPLRHGGGPLFHDKEPSRAEGAGPIDGTKYLRQASPESSRAPRRKPTAPSSKPSSSFLTNLRRSKRSKEDADGE